jgi:hypothetical protein
LKKATPGGAGSRVVTVPEGIPGGLLDEFAGAAALPAIPAITPTAAHAPAVPAVFNSREWVIEWLL